jgi:isocitrate dehydrogenase kinase/phosphatase
MPTIINDAPALASVIATAFASYHDAFRYITRRARGHFEEREWSAAQASASARLALYEERVAATVAAVRAWHTTPDWTLVKRAYRAQVCTRNDAEIAESFFNSVVRRIRGTIGSDPEIDFTAPDEPPDGDPPFVTLHTHRLDAAAVTDILQLFTFSIPWTDLRRDAMLAAAIAGVQEPIVAVDVVPSVFYRNKGAYIVSRIRRERGRPQPFILALMNGPRGLRVDAALPTADEASVVFGFSWSYFHVDIDRPRALVGFLASMMPSKRVDELYTAIGYNRHGKTELYRSLMRHLERPDARFEIAEGDVGTVMSVFTLPSFNVVFKIIKDAFGFPKRTTRRGVMDRYRFVFVRDRVGRLADAQEFESMEFPVTRFARPLLEDLLATCGRTVRVDGHRVVVRHLYTERRVTPLNLYLKQASPEEAQRAALDYGTAIKDLAGADIFTGDMLLKNFGVTRHGRVICYDYDELALLSECNFREIPRAVDVDEEMAAEPAYHVGDHDVFPEEFRAFLVPPGALRDAFLAAHGDLLDVMWWRDRQTRVRAGELLDLIPYRPERRLP